MCRGRRRMVVSVVGSRGPVGQRDSIAVHRRVLHRRAMHGRVVHRHRLNRFGQREARDRRSDRERSDGQQGQPAASAQTTADRVHAPL